MAEFGVVVNERIHSVPLQSPTLPPATETNAVLIGERDFYVVDPATPYPEEQVKFDALIAVRLQKGHKFLAILLTHHHDDHVGDANRLREKFKVEIWAHVITKELVGFPVDRLMDDGFILPFAESGSPIVTIFTPGHAPGHVCFFDTESKVLVVGDMVASEGTILIEPQLGNLGDYLDSLQKLLALQPSVVIPSHGAPIKNGAQKIDYTLAHRKLRLQQLEQLLPKQAALAQSVEQLVADIYGPRISPLVRKLAALSLTSSLKLLASRGRAQRDENLSWWGADEEKY